MREYRRAYTDLTGSLLIDLYKQKETENIALSPFSVMVLLGMAAQASAGETRKQILQTLGTDDPVRAIQGIQEALDKEPGFHSANAVFVQEALKNAVSEGYPEALKRDYNGKLFASEDIISDINKWTKKQTRGMIKDIAGESMKQAVMGILSASVFQRSWTQHYSDDDIEPMEFRNADGTVKETDTIRTLEDMFIRDTLVTGFVKPYKRSGCSFMALLPKLEGEEALLQVLENLDLSAVFEERINVETAVYLPEFAFQQTFDIREYCRAQGITELFTEQADFSPLSVTPVHLDTLIHKAAIDVSRKGTKAAAVSMGIIDVTGAFFPEMEVKLDRPFIWAVMHNKTALPVFAGVVNRL